LTFGKKSWTAAACVIAHCCMLLLYPIIEKN